LPPIVLKLFEARQGDCVDGRHRRPPVRSLTSHHHPTGLTSTPEASPCAWLKSPVRHAKFAVTALQAIEVEGLTKVYPPGLRAVDGISFSVADGESFGLLGPNGAGKTTTIKMVTTLSRPTAGSVFVFGVNALESPSAVRQMLGYVTQAVSVDGDLTGYENLLIFAKLYNVGKKDRDERIGQVLKYMGLQDRANDLVKHYSGGMMRRLEIAQALVNRPRVLFLDEPTIGLDPSSKREVWLHIKRLIKEFGTTVFLTTHDMVEADELCDRIAIMNLGKIVGMGTPAELKKSVGGDVITLRLSDSLPGITLPTEVGTVARTEGELLTILSANGEEAVPRIIQHFERLGLRVVSISMNRPTLDDVFMKYTKTSLVDAGTFREARSTRRSFMRRAR